MRTFKNEAEAFELVNTLPWGTAAGTTKDPRMAIRYAQAGAKIVTFGSITWDQRDGNKGDNFYYDERTGNSINALGIPNAGFNHYLPLLAELKKEVNALGAELWVSISAGNAFVPQEYEDMTVNLFAWEAADVVAGNFSCPNIEVNGKRKPVVCYDLQAYTEGIKAMRAASRGRPIAVKIAPITEASLLQDLVDTAKLANVAYIEMANTIPNCFLEKPDGTPAISVVRGGLAGAALIPQISGMIQIAKPRLDGSNTKLIAIGGVRDGSTAYHYLKQGADGFEFNTVLSARGGHPGVITKIITGDGETPGLLELLVEHGL